MEKNNQNEDEGVGVGEGASSHPQQDLSRRDGSQGEKRDKPVRSMPTPGVPGGPDEFRRQKEQAERPDSTPGSPFSGQQDK
jgi:hypothetical protein